MAENSPLRANSFGDAAAQLKDKMVAIGERYVRDGRGGGVVEPNPAFDARGAAKAAYEEGLRQQGQAASRAGAMQMNAGAPPLPQTPAAATIPAQPTGATNATAGQAASGVSVGPNNSGQAMAQPAGQPSSGGGTAATTEVAKRPGLRGYIDSARAVPGAAGRFIASEASNLARGFASEAGGALLGAGAQAYHELPGIHKVFGSDQATDIDKGTQLYEGIARSANVGAGAAIGAKGGAMLGAMTGPAAPIAVPALTVLGGIGGGIYGNYATNRAIEAGRTLAGTDTTSPAARIPTAPTAPTRIPFDQTPQASYSNEGNNYRGANPTLREQFVRQKALDADLANQMSNASLQKANPGGQVTKTVDKDGRVTYSGKTVSGLVSLVDGNGKALPGQPGGGLIQGTGDGTTRFATQAQIDSLRNPAGGGASAPALITPAEKAQMLNPFGGVGLALRNAQVGLSGMKPGDPRIPAQQKLIDELAGSVDAFNKEATTRHGANQQLAGIQAQAAAAKYTADRSYQGHIDLENLKQKGVRDTLRLRQDRMAGYFGANGGKGGAGDLNAARTAAAAAHDKDALEIIDSLIKGAQEQTSKQGSITKDNIERLASKIVFPVYKDGVQTDARNKFMEASALQHILSQRKEIANLPDAELNRVLPQLLGEWEALQRINEAKMEQKGVTFKGWSPHLNGSVPTTMTMPDLRGTTLGKSRGIGDGWDIGTGDYYIEGMNGGDGMHRLPPMSAEAVAAIQRAQGLR